MAVDAGDDLVAQRMYEVSKFLSLGLSPAQIVRCVTSTPAAAIRRPDVGRLAVGGPAEATVLGIEEGAFTFRDSLGETFRGERRFVLKGVVIGGQWWDPE